MYENNTTISLSWASELAGLDKKLGLEYSIGSVSLAKGVIDSVYSREYGHQIFDENALEKILSESKLIGEKVGMKNTDIKSELLKGYLRVDSEDFNGENEEGKFGLELGFYEKDGCLDEALEISFFETMEEREQYLISLLSKDATLVDIDKISNNDLNFKSSDENIDSVKGKFIAFYGEDNLNFRVIDFTKENSVNTFDMESFNALSFLEKRLEVNINETKETIYFEFFKKGQIEMVGLDDIQLNKNNIPLYYEFMDESDISNLSNSNLRDVTTGQPYISTFLAKNFNEVREKLGIDIEDMHKNRVCTYGLNDAVLEQTLFGVKDTLEDSSIYAEKIKDSIKKGGFELKTAPKFLNEDVGVENSSEAKSKKIIRQR